MRIAELRLVNFRSWADERLTLAPGLNIVVGRNASGKTNLLEGAWFALRASSPRTNRDEKTVRWGASFARVEATLEGAAGGGAARRTVSVAFAPGQGKRVLIDGVEARSLDDLRRQGVVIVFVPESLLLVKGGPARRRAHLDGYACAVDPAYEAALRDLSEALRQRNAQLARVREGGPEAALDPWDVQLARAAGPLAARRRALVEALAERFAGYAEALSPGGGVYELALVTQMDGIEPGEEAFLEALRQRRAGEVSRAVSAFGPHRDDLRLAEVRIDADAADPAAGTPGAPAASAVDPEGQMPERRDLRTFGSQGEQRAAVLALLLAERAVAARLTGDLGTLLLDDVMSELDDARRRLLVRLLAADGQAIVTTTNRHYFTAAELEGANVVAIGPEGPDPEEDVCG